MKKNTIFIIIGLIFTLGSCTNVDLYGRDKNEIYTVEGPFDKVESKINNKEKPKVENEIIRVVYTKETPITEAKKTVKNSNIIKEKNDPIIVESKPQVNLEKEIRYEENNTYKVSNVIEEKRKNVVLEKPVVSDPKDYKNIKIFTAEIPKEKPVEKEIKKEEKPKVIENVKKVENKKTEIKNQTTTYKDIQLNENDLKVLSLIKSHYGMIETYDIMVDKTKELIFKIRQKQDKDIFSTVVLNEIHEMIKETKTRSFILAVDRVERNRGLK